MNPKERFLTAVRRGVPDLVPVAPLIHCRFAQRVLTHFDWRAVFDVHRLIGSIHFRGPLGIAYDLFEGPLGLGPAGEHDEGWSRESRTEFGADGRVFRCDLLRTPLGELTSTYVYRVISGDPLVGKTIQYPVKKHADWDVYRAFLERSTACVAEPDLGTIEEAYAVMGDDGVPSVGIDSVFNHMGYARGMGELLLDLMDIPDQMSAVWDVALAQHLQMVDAFLASPSEVVFYDICWATGARMSPRMFERWVLPDVRQAVERVHAVPGRAIGLYTLGPIRHVLPMLVEAGVDFIETFEPNQGDISLGEAKRLYGDRICLMGNFDCVVLARGTVEDAQRETMRCLREGMEGGGYVMVTADEVPADAKLDNLKVMVDTVEQYGRYQ